VVSGVQTCALPILRLREYQGNIVGTITRQISKLKKKK